MMPTRHSAFGSMLGYHHTPFGLYLLPNPNLTQTLGGLAEVIRAEASLRSS